MIRMVNAKIIASAIIIVIILVIISLLAISGTKSLNTTTIPVNGGKGSTSTAATTIPLTTTVPSYITGGGPGKSFISNSEVTSLIGITTSYQGAPEGQLSAYINSTIKASPTLGFLKNNVTNVWTVAAKSASGASLNEIVYQSSVSSQLYKYSIGAHANYTYTAEATNLSVNGMTYSYYQQDSGSSTIIYIIGTKDSDTGVLIINGPVSLNAKITAAATIMSNDTA